MSMPSGAAADYLVDRRKLRRALSFWRVLAFVIAAFAILGVAFASLSGSGVGGGPHIARLAIEGVITGDAETLKLIRDIAKSKAAAVIITIESPGGTVTGSEKLYDEIRLLAEKKPVAAVVGTMAASGAYIAALGTDAIFAKGSSLVGSIGVIFQFPNVAKLLDTLGVKMEEVKSSPLKAAPNGFEPTSEGARAAMAALVTDSFDWFKGLVRERRKMSDAELAAVADGRVFTGRQAIALKLVDRIGGEREAIAWLETEKGIAKDLPVRDWKASRSFERLGLFGAVSKLAEFAGLPHLARQIAGLGEAGEARALDGLVAIWHFPDN